MRWFADPAVGAVAGNAKVGNRINMITRWQALEYVTSQNLERRALAALGCITVVPGAVGAWRREALELGGFPLDTLAEDQDLTMAMLTAGYTVLYDSSAIGWTEAPDTVRALIKQRFRWAFGTLQCLWKHRRVTLRPRYGALGLIAVPQTWLFQFLLTVDRAARGPGADLAAHLRQPADCCSIRISTTPNSLRKVLIYYLVFLLIDLGSATLALMMERREKWRLVPLLVLQRFGYRQLMYWVVLKALFTAAIGPLVGWGKLERKATVGAQA